MAVQDGNVVKRGDVFEKKLRKKQEKILIVQRNVKVYKQTLQEGRGKEMLLPPVQQTTGTSSTTLSPDSASETHIPDDCPGQMLRKS